MSLAGVVNGLKNRRRIPGQKYAIFSHKGRCPRYGKRWMRFGRAAQDPFIESLPKATPLDPFFQCDGENFDPITDERGVEISVPVADLNATVAYDALKQEAACPRLSP